jgi:dephospho-CoA kinase
MYKVGLTGNFYSGHDDIAKIFKKKGIPVFDADIILKFMINYSEKHVKIIQETFGKSIYKFGLLDLNQFNDNKKFEKLLDIVQLDLIKAYEKWRIRNYNHFYTIFKSSVLFEKGWDKYMNFNINVFKPERDRVLEIIEKTEMPSSVINDIINNEMDELSKNTKSDYVIHNYSGYYGTKYTVVNQIDNINRLIMNKNIQKERFEINSII